ncbi:MAG: hypothetical protein M1838_004276 [Thelocarpon superellum]|nr:MAG: hypothetical protein M1838_004276 [Thelocarpon superellum]
MPSYFFHLSFELSPSSGPLSSSHRGSDGGVYRIAPGTDLFKARLPSHPLPTPPPPPGADEAIAVTAPHDPRCDYISVQSIDMTPGVGRVAEASHGGSLGDIGNRLGAGSGGSAAKAKFVSIDPKNTELGWGIVHLYRDVEETPGLYDEVGHAPVPATAVAHPSRPLGADEAKQVADEDCTTLCILAVPSYLAPSDFLGFVGESTREMVSHFRMIRTARTNRYMVLMKFRSPKKAKQWRKEWNGKVFNSMEPETCHVVFVKSIEFQTPGQRPDASSFPDITNDPFTPATAATHGAGPGGSVPLPSTSSVSPATSLTTKPLAPPTPALVELPTCPVCLERMDETTGLLTILCQHVFHCACLQKWRGSGCPVCRYTQGDGLASIYRSHLPAADEALEKCCSVCRSDSNLWVCLICGNVGCGRYDEAHAFTHWRDTSHCYAMDVDSQRVWDYAGDGYVHRLIQNKADGKLVELPSPDTRAPLGHDGSIGAAVPREKLDDIGMEYTHLLISQLESQRLYFEEKVAHAADKASVACQAAETAATTTQRTRDALASLQASYDTLVKVTIPGLERDKERAERRADKLAETAKKMQREWKDEKAMSESLLERVERLGREVVTLQEQRTDLEEQNRDLTFFISGQQKLEGLGEEVEQGTVSVGATPSSQKKAKGKGRR